MHSITRFGHLDSSSGHSFTLFALRAVVASSCIVVVDAGGDWGGWDGARSHPMVSAEEIHISAEGIERLSCSTRDGTLSVVGKPGGEASFVVVEKRAWGDTEADAAQNLAKIKVGVWPERSREKPRTAKSRPGVRPTRCAWLQQTATSPSASMAPECWRVTSRRRTGMSPLACRGRESLGGEGRLRGHSENGSVVIR